MTATRQQRHATVTATLYTRISPKLIERMREIALSGRVSVNSLVVEAITEYIHRIEKLGTPK